jgi:hypothetical protein
MNDYLGYKQGELVDQDQLDINKSYQETIDTLSNELEEAGVAKSVCINFARFLYTIYVTRCSVILAGPNGEHIANALSVSIFGKKADIIDCSIVDNCQIFELAEKSDNAIILIKNLFNSRWRVQLAERLQNTDRQFIIIHPFIEDLAIEPRSLFSYAFPIVTETIINGKPTGFFVGGKNKKPYQELKLTNEIMKPDPILRNLNVGYPSGKMMSTILDAFESYWPEAKSEVAYLFIYFSYAYITGQGEKLIDEKLGLLPKTIQSIIKPYFNDEL